MINAAIIGLGWWGKTLIEAMSDGSDAIRFVAGATRTRSSEVEDFARLHDFKLHDSLEDVIADDRVDAVVLATPHSMHAPQIIAAGGRGRHGNRAGATVLRHHLVDQGVIDDFGAHFRKAR